MRGGGSRRGKFHFGRSVAHSFLIFRAVMSLLTVYFHLNIGFPPERIPSVFILTTDVPFYVSSPPYRTRTIATISLSRPSHSFSLYLPPRSRCSSMLIPIVHHPLLSGKTARGRLFAMETPVHRCMGNMYHCHNISPHRVSTFYTI